MPCMCHLKTLVKHLRYTGGTRGKRQLTAHEGEFVVEDRDHDLLVCQCEAVMCQL